MVLSVVLCVLLTGVFAFAAFKIYKNSENLKLAKWARRNKTEARWILVGFNLAMALTGVSLGFALSNMGLTIGEPALYTGLGIFLIGTILFPSKAKSDPKIAFRYRRKQLLTVMRIGGSALALIAYTNTFMADNGDELYQQAAVHPAVWVILATAGLVLFGFLILALSCGLACNGYEGAALTLLIGGGAGLIILYVWVLRKIFDNHRKQKSLKSGNGNRTIGTDETLDGDDLEDIL